MTEAHYWMLYALWFQLIANGQEHGGWTRPCAQVVAGLAVMVAGWERKKALRSAL